jgi:N-methylhydantoinase A
MRYLGQGHELDVPVAPRTARAALRDAFVSLHEQRYGFSLDAPVEVVSVRHAAEGAGRNVHFSRVTGHALRVTKPLKGPRSLALSDATLFVARGWTARLHAHGHWILTR